MKIPPVVILVAFFSSLCMVSCAENIAGYYQGIFTSTHNMHPEGAAKMNLAQNNSNTYDITLEAVNWKLIQYSNISVYPQSSGLGYSSYRIKSADSKIEGEYTLYGHLAINYKEGPLTITFNVKK